jgi:hypothetical protein
LTNRPQFARVWSCDVGLVMRTFPGQLRKTDDFKRVFGLSLIFCKSI